MLMTRVASVQLALLKTRATHGSSGVVISDRSATARTKNAIGTTTRFGGRKGSGAANRWKCLKNGSANSTIAPTTAKESWKPVENSSFVFQQRMKNAAAARLFGRNTRRSKK